MFQNHKSWRVRPENSEFDNIFCFFSLCYLESRFYARQKNEAYESTLIVDNT